MFETIDAKTHDMLIGLNGDQKRDLLAKIKNGIDSLYRDVHRTDPNKAEALYIYKVSIVLDILSKRFKTWESDNKKI